MKIQNNGRTLMLPGSVVADTSESLPSNPHAGDEVVAINSGGTHTYTLTGTIDGVSNLAIAHGDSATLIYTSGGWLSVGSSGGGGGGGVTLQADTPGTPDAGNFNVSGTGIFGGDAVIGGDLIVTNRINTNSPVAGLVNFLAGADFGGNSIANVDTGTFSVLSIHNASNSDGASASLLAFSDTNAALSLSNACIVYQTVAGAKGNIQIIAGGADNDTPGATVNFDVVGATGQVRVGGVSGIDTGNAQLFTVYGDGYFDGAVTFNAIPVFSSGIGPLVSALDLTGHDILNGGAFTFQNDSQILANSNVYFSDSSGAARLSTDGAAGFEILVGGVGPTGNGNTAIRAFVSGDTTIEHKLAVGSTTIGSHQLDVTGDAAVTTNLWLPGIAAASGAAGLVYADPVTHALFVSV